MSKGRPKADKPPKVTMTFRIDPEVHEKLRRFAEEQNRTPSNMVETILKFHFGMLENKPEGEDNE